MRKRYLSLTTAVMLVVALAMGGTALAGHRIQDEGRGTVSLDRVGDAPEQANGTAKFKLTEDEDGVNRLKVKLTVRNLPERAGRVFEVWLTDNDTSHDDSIGVFQTDNDGDGQLSITRSMTHFSQYDEIVISSEKKQDKDPTINGPVLLRGKLH